MDEKITIAEYCKQKKITTQKLCYATHISYSRLSMIKNTKNPNVNIDTILALYNGTKELFGEEEALTPFMYLDLPNIWR